MINLVVVSGALICLEPSPDWQWHGGWSGEVEVSLDMAIDKKLSIDGKPAMREIDLRLLLLKLVGKPYTSTGFSDIPGILMVTDLTLQNGGTMMTVESVGAETCYLTDAATGLFQATVIVPSQKVAGPVITPDLVMAKQGTWSVKQSGQSPELMKAE